MFSVCMCSLAKEKLKPSRAGHFCLGRPDDPPKKKKKTGSIIATSKLTSSKLSKLFYRNYVFCLHV